MQDFIIYELHVGTFTKQGTFDGAVGHLDYLTDLGMTAVELMPVCQFPGNRNWGYDGVYPFAPQNTLWRPQRAEATDRRLSRERTGAWSWTWSTTTSDPRATISGFWPLFHR